MPHSREQSVFLAQWYELPETLAAGALMNEAYWEKIRRVRDAVNRELEAGRRMGKIGSALAARVELFCDGSLQAELALLGDELRFVLITSGAQVFPLDKNALGDAVATDIAGLFVRVIPAEDVKCVRCWHRRADVAMNSMHPELCLRCVENVEGPGEVRRFA